MKHGISSILLFFLTLLTNLFAAKTDSLETWVYVHFQQEKYEVACNLLTELINQKPENAIFYFQRGEANYNLKKYQEALNDFQKANQLAEAYASLYLAKIYALLGNHSEALIFLTLHLKSKFKKPESEIRLDPDFNSLSKTTGWSELWKGNWYNKREQEIAEINYFIIYEKYQEALALINKNIQSGSRLSIWFFLRGKVFTGMGQFQLAVKDFAEASKKSPNNLEYLIEYGLSLIQAKDYKKGVSILLQALNKQCCRVDLYKNIAMASCAYKNYNDAIFYMEKYTFWYSEDTEAFYELGLMYYEAGKYIQAMQTFSRLIEKNNMEEKYYIGRGNAYLKAKAYKYAEMDFSMALDFNPDNDLVYLSRGLARYYLGNTDGACRDWQVAEKFGNLKAIVYQNDYCKTIKK